MQLRSRIPFILILILGSVGAFSASAQWTGPTGAPPTGSPSSFISGAGSAGRVTYWDGPSSVTSDPNFVWDNTNTRLGIGTPAPGQRLTVSSAGDVYLRVEKPSFPDQLDIGIATHQARIGYTTTPATNADINFLTNGTSRMFIRDDGNIGIGTTGPGDRLHIRGGGAIIENTADPRLRFRTDSNNEWYVWDDTSAAGVLRFAGKKAGVWNWQVLVLDKGGNVGIGDTTPTYKLDVNGTGRFTGLLTVPTPSVSENAANKGYVDTAVAGVSQNLFETINAPSGTDPVADSITDTLNLATSGSLSITGNSTNDTITLNASINSCAAGSSIRVINANGTVSCETDDGGMTSFNIANSANATQFTITGGADKLQFLDGTGLNIAFDNVNDRVTYSADTAYLQRRNSAATCAGSVLVDINSNGTYVCEADNTGGVSGGAANKVAYWTGASTLSNDSLFHWDATNNRLGIGTTGPVIDLAIGDTDTGINQDGDGVLELWTNNVDRLHITNTGNVGIGDATPSYKLDINSGNGAIRIGPNASYSESLLLGGWGTSTTSAWVRSSNGNLHMDSKAGQQMYLNNYTNGSVYIATGGGNVGIGDSTPSYKLDVAGDTQVQGWLRTTGQRGWYSQTYGGGWYMADPTWIRSYGNKPVYVQNTLRTDGELQAGSGGSRFIVKTNGRVGIGDTTPDAKLDVEGNIIMRGTSPTMYYQDTDNRSAMIHVNSNLWYVLRGCGNDSLSWCTILSRWPLVLNLTNNDATFGGAVYANAFYYNSDIALKENIRPLDSTLDRVMQLKPVTFDWKQEWIDGDTADIGLIAQDVEKLFPELVKDAGDGIKSLDYAGLTTPIIGAMQEQQKKIDAQEEQIASQQAQIDALQTTVTELIMRIDGDSAPSALGDAVPLDASVSNMQLNYDEGVELKSGLLFNAWSVLVRIFANE